VTRGVEDTAAAQRPQMKWGRRLSPGAGPTGGTGPGAAGRADRDPRQHHRQQAQRLQASGGLASDTSYAKRFFGWIAQQLASGNSEVFIHYRQLHHNAVRSGNCDDTFCYC
jgi:hypothetical protein